MSVEMITQLPTVTSAQLSDIIYAVQGYISPASPGTSVQETLAQVLALGLSQTILSYAGNPNGNVAGTTYQLLWDTTDSVLYICTTTGNAAGAVWTLASGFTTPLATSKGGTGVVSPTAHGLMVAEGASPINLLSLTNGQIPIGSTGADPVGATLTAGTNISIANGAGTITINASGFGGFSWNNVTGTTQAMTSNNGYIANNAALVTLTLPSSSNVGDQLGIAGFGAGGWTIAQGASQIVHIGSSASTAGVGGSVSSTNRYDSLWLVCAVANTTWTLVGAPQSSGLTIV